LAAFSRLLRGAACLLFADDYDGSMIVRTVPFAGAEGFTARQYAEALAARPEMDYDCGPSSIHPYRLQTRAAVHGSTLCVDYRNDSFTILSTSSETSGFLSIFTSWYWVPGIRRSTGGFTASGSPAQ